MDIEFVILRILHIGFGVFWVGSALFLVLILEPRLRALGPAIQVRSWVLSHELWVRQWGSADSSPSSPA